MNSMGVRQHECEIERPKCAFVKPSVEYFVFVVDQYGIHPSPHKVPAIFKGSSYRRIQFLPDGSLFVLIIITNKVVINK